MASSRITYTLPPHIDPTKAPLAFGRRGIPKLNRELQDDVLITRQRALMTLCDLVHDPEKVYEAVQVGCVPSLKTLLDDEDDTVRHKAVEVLFVMAQHSIARLSFVDLDVISPIAVLFDDEQDIVRKFAYQAIEMISENPSGASGVVDEDLIPAIVHKLNIELDELKVPLLDCLHFCARINPEEALANGAMVVLADLLHHDDTEIRYKAARGIMDVSVPLRGKREAVAHQHVVVTLVKMLDDFDIEVQTYAAGAMMTIAITTEGKFAFIEAAAIPGLERLAKDMQCSEARLYATKALTMLAEAPVGRKRLLRYATDRESRDERDPNLAVNCASRIACKVITWKP